MSFDWPLALIALLVVPVLVFVYMSAERRRRAQASRFGTPALLAGIVVARPRLRRHVPFVLLLVALSALILGVARPKATLSVPREEATIMLALDTSFSMAATDVKPSRLKAALAAAASFLDKVPERYRVGLVSFSTQAQLILPPTADRLLAKEALAQIRLGQGTAIGSAIVRAVQAVRPPGQRPSPDDVPATILLLSDGAQTGAGPTPVEAAVAARRAGIPVSTVALGTSDAVVEVPLPGGLKERVVVAPDKRTLQAVAQQAGGRFYEAPSAEQLEEVYRELGSRIGKVRQRKEITAAFAGAGGVLALVAAAVSMLWFRRPL